MPALVRRTNLKVPISKARTSPTLLTQQDIFPLELPLVNAESFFSVSAWDDVLDFIARRLHHLGVKPRYEDTFTLHVKDLYFRKLFRSYDYARARTLFAPFGNASPSTEESDDDDKPQIRIGEHFRLYYYKGATCFGAGGAVASDDDEIREGSFPNKPIEWQTNSQVFFDFITAIEDAFTGRGSTLMCRAFFTLKIGDYVTVSVQCLHESAVGMYIGVHHFGLSSPPIKPEFTVTFHPRK